MDWTSARHIPIPQTRFPYYGRASAADACVGIVGESCLGGRYNGLSSPSFWGRFIAISFLCQLLFGFEEEQQGCPSCHGDSVVHRHADIANRAVVAVSDRPIFAHLPKFLLMVVSDGPIFAHVAHLATVAINDRAIFPHVTYFVPVVIAGCAVIIHLTELASSAIVHVHSFIVSQRVRGTQSTLTCHSLHSMCPLMYATSCRSLESNCISPSQSHYP